MEHNEGSRKGSLKRISKLNYAAIKALLLFSMPLGGVRMNILGIPNCPL